MTIPSWKFSFGTDRHTDAQTHRSTHRGGAHLKITNIYEKKKDNLFPYTRKYWKQGNQLKSWKGWKSGNNFGKSGESDQSERL